MFGREKLIALDYFRIMNISEAAFNSPTISIRNTRYDVQLHASNGRILTFLLGDTDGNSSISRARAVLPSSVANGPRADVQHNGSPSSSRAQNRILLWQDRSASTKKVRFSIPSYS